jgi:hypothetical protein
MRSPHHWLLLACTTAACTPIDYHRCGKADYVSLTMRGSNWNDIGDNILHLRVYEPKDDWVEQSEVFDLPKNGELDVELRCELDDGGEYNVAYYIETNGDTGCQRSDRSWTQEVGRVNNDVLLEVDPSDPQDPLACDHF